MRIRLVVGLTAVLVLLSGIYAAIRAAQIEPTPEERPVVWSVEFLELARVSIGLPRRDLAESWFKGDDKQWYFEPHDVQVDRSRWGGGVPLILSSPQANRALVTSATDDQLADYGLTDPSMVITLSTDSGVQIDIELGDQTPVGNAYYIRRADSRDVYTIDHSWYDVLERLVIDPPYPGIE